MGSLHNYWVAEEEVGPRPQGFSKETDHGKEKGGERHLGGKLLRSRVGIPGTVGSVCEVGRQVYAWAPGLGEVEHRWRGCICGRIMGRGQSLGVRAEMGPTNTLKMSLFKPPQLRGKQTPGNIQKHSPFLLPPPPLPHIYTEPFCKPNPIL